jgi:hypothetical protein
MAPKMMRKGFALLWLVEACAARGESPPPPHAESVHRSEDSDLYTPNKDALKPFRPAGSKATKSRSSTPITSTKKKSRRRTRPSGAERRAHILDSDTINAALVGEQLSPDGQRVAHQRCRTRLPNGSACFSELWTSKDAFETHLSTFMGYKQEVRTETVFNMLRGQYYRDQDASGQPVGEKRWHYVINTDRGGVREVCRDVFLLNYPIGSKTLGRLKARILEGRTMAHAKREEGDESRNPGSRVDLKTLSVIGWYQGYANTIGDWMPDDQELVVPRRDRSDEFSEYESALGEEACSFTWFCHVVRTASELSHIGRARKLLNFQHCTQCVDLNEEVKQAMLSKDPDRIAAAKARRTAHHQRTRAERLEYYRHRELGRNSSNVLSLILDKWDSNKTTVPYFARSPGHWWSALKHEVLEQHVLGVLVHGMPNRHYFFSFNRSISGDANMNVEGIRRTLIHLCSSSPSYHLPRTIYVQGDNASDNKCWVLLLFFAMLVFHDYTADIYFSFLIVGHTHEDIDQIFSTLSRFIKGIGCIADPQQFSEEMAAAMEKRLARFEHVFSVFDWNSFLRPSLISPVPVGIQHANFEHETLVPHTFWIHRRARDGKVVVHYKEFSADEIWLPSVKGSDPKVSDQDGFEIFKSSTPPPDPAHVTPSEVVF